MEDIKLDLESYDIPFFYIESDKLVSYYQGRLYEEAEIFNENGSINKFSFAEYFSEGYNTYINNPQLLKEKDPDLFNFIERM